MVTEDNHNKDYIMTSNGDNFTVEWGRFGQSMQSTTYPNELWDTKLREKLKKGYREISLGSNSNLSSFVSISDKPVNDFFNYLLSYSKNNTDLNYSVAVGSVSKAQIYQAQEYINKLSIISDIFRFNKTLLDLFHIIPRKMKKVHDFLLTDLYQAHILLKREQDLLDSLQGQIPIESGKTITESLGIEIEKCDLDKGMYHLVDNKNYKILNCFRVKKDDKLEDMPFRFLWHGSRSGNWLSILKEGLKIRPSGVIITGAMFGHGIYFSPVMRKSIGYTSLYGSHWANGNNDKGVIGIYKVNTGKELRVKSHESYMYNLSKETLMKKGYNSLYAEAGGDLKNPEVVVYSENQCSIYYIMEVSHEKVSN